MIVPLQLNVHGQTVEMPTASPSAQLSSGQNPEWLAWKVFYQSLIFYQKQSPSLVDQMLHAKFGLNASETTAFWGAMKMFVTTIDAIDSRARSEAQLRFGTQIPLRSKTKPTGTGEPVKSFLQRAREGGLFDSVENEKRAALSAHLAAIRNLITADEIAAMTAWVQGSVAPRITTVESEAPRRPISTTK
jgi:hypothetical protein